MSGLFNNAQGVIIHNGTFMNNITSREPQSPLERLLSAASPSAFFNSGDQLDAPKCHPNTRVAILDALRDFAFSQGDMALIKAMWLNGPAGAGKSAIARSLCEEFHAANALLASYFFKRTDGSRNTHKSFVATITYDIYGTVPEPYRALILGVIQDDPLIFTRSLTTQWESLITSPLRELFESNYFHTVSRRLIVIDGLDECSTVAAQISILKEIHRVSLAGSPFLFVVASRPEHDIQSFLSSSSWKSPGCLLYRLDLEASYQADEDIGRFLVDKLHVVCLDHPHKDNIPTGWPSARIIQTLVDKAAGLFIYASLVIGYVASNRHQPHKRLDMVLGLRPPKGGLPFAELDMLYNQILSSCQDVGLALEIISFTSMFRDLNTWSLESFAYLNALDIDDCLAALVDLRSIIDIKPHLVYASRHTVSLTHKSLVDYLHNSSRSGKYYRDESLAICKLAGQILQRTSDTGGFALGSPMTRFFFLRYFPQLLQNIHVSKHEFMLLSLPNWYKTSILNTYSNHPPEEASGLFISDFWEVFPLLIRGLERLAATDHKYVYDYYRAQFRDLNAAHPNLIPTRRSPAIAHDALSVMFISYYPDFPMPDSEDISMVHTTLRTLRLLPYSADAWRLYSELTPRQLHDWGISLMSRNFDHNSARYCLGAPYEWHETLAEDMKKASKYDVDEYRSFCEACWRWLDQTCTELPKDVSLYELMLLYGRPL